MSPARRLFVHVLVAVVLGGNAVALVSGRQIWPYSPYAMFADATEEKDLHVYDTYVLVGESTTGEEFWFERQGYLGRAISPMTLNSAFRVARERDGVEGIHMRLRDAADFYERRRVRNLMDAPPLARLSLYRFAWALRPDLANLRTPARTLVATHVPAAPPAP